MARIRTIKPEFWTDSKIVQLPYEARLLFIGMWNFSDDEGYVASDPEQLRLQILPNDDVNIDELIDLLWATGLIELASGGDRDWIVVKNFTEHQKVSHPTKSVIAPEVSGKKQSIPAHVRRSLAMKYGCDPGGRASCNCYYCGADGSIWWPKTSKGKPSYWVAFTLEIDHFNSEHLGGATTSDNLVFACRHCNRSKHTTDGLSRILQSIPENSGALQPEGNGKERKGKEGNGKELFNCGESEDASPPQPVLTDWTFPVDNNNGKEWVLTQAKYDEYRESFPALDLDAELRAARQWCRDNRSNRKDPSGMTRFLGNWLKKAQNNPHLRASVSPIAAAKVNKKYATVEVPDDL